MKTITTSQGRFVFIPKSQPFRIDFKEPFKAIGYCSEIIKDDELAKSIIDKSINSGLYSNYIGCIKMYSKSFASLLQANDIDLNEQDWFVVKKL